LRPNGEPSIEVRTANLPDITTVSCARVDHIVFLDRKASGPPELEPVSKSNALGQLQAAVFLWESQVYQEKLKALQTLLEASTHTLRYADLDRAVEILESLVYGARRR